MTAWDTFRERAVAAYEAAIVANPLQFRETVEAFVRALSESRASLDRIQTLLAQVDDPALRDQAAALEGRYATLSFGVFADAERVGAAPVGLAVAGVFVGVAGIAWAVAAYQYAVNLREHTGLLEQELAARVEASRAGRSLAPASIPPVTSPIAEARSVGMLLLGGLTLAAAAIAVPVLLKKAG